jgi:hypothetical protein
MAWRAYLRYHTDCVLVEAIHLPDHWALGADVFQGAGERGRRPSHLRGVSLLTAPFSWLVLKRSSKPFPRLSKDLYYVASNSKPSPELTPWWT